MTDEAVVGTQGQLLRIPADLPDQRAETWYIRPEDGGMALYCGRRRMCPAVLLAQQQADVARAQQLVEQSRAEMAKFMYDFSAINARTRDDEVEELWGLDDVRLSPDPPGR